MVTIDTFLKTKDYLICVDSDGCAMDTMNIKHIRCFGPCMVDEWRLHDYADAILTRWNDINLFTMTRGINRFKGLSLALREIDSTYVRIDDLQSLVSWVNDSDELSNGALKRAIDNNPESISLKKALSWSEAVNKNIKQLPQSEIKPFSLVLDALKFAHEKADIAIVSSANLEAVKEEWQKHGLLQHVDIIMAQDSGSKAYCISKLIEKGYDKMNILMCGDAPGDMDAAKINDVSFYPILVKREKESWQEFIDTAFDKLISNDYVGEYQQTKINEFYKNLEN